MEKDHGFLNGDYGTMYYSENKLYKAFRITGSGYKDKGEHYKPGYLCFYNGDNLLNEFEIETLDCCAISTNGYLFFIEVHNASYYKEIKITGTFVSPEGEIVWTSTGAFCSFCCAINENGTKVAFEITPSSDKERNRFVVIDARTTQVLMNCDSKISNHADHMELLDDRLILNFTHINKRDVLFY